jgi:hypothetical protein
MKYKNKLINKAIKLYKYDEIIDFEKENQNFYDGYSFSFNNYKKNKYNFDNFWNVLKGSRTNYSHHLVAKNLLYQENPDCWKYFERTSLFWVKSNINDFLYNNLKSVLEYSIYVERSDFVEILLEKFTSYFNNNGSDIEFKNQKIYPSTSLLFFLIEKWLGIDFFLDKNFNYDYGIYKQLIDNWNNISNLNSKYWDSLCEYHLTHMGLSSGDDYIEEEFLGVGLVPMEIINIIKVREGLKLPIPSIAHELFQTPMSKFPVLPSGYDEELDVKYQLVKLTVENKTKYSYSEVIERLQKIYGSNVKFFL